MLPKCNIGGSELLGVVVIVVLDKAVADELPLGFDGNVLKTRQEFLWMRQCNDPATELGASWVRTQLRHGLFWRETFTMFLNARIHAENVAILVAGKRKGSTTKLDRYLNAILAGWCDAEPSRTVLEHVGGTFVPVFARIRVGFHFCEVPQLRHKNIPSKKILSMRLFGDHLAEILDVQ